MRLGDISLIGWLHSIACVVALLAGAYVLAARKGTRRHKRLGYWYVGATITLNVSALVIFRFDMLPGPNGSMGANIFGIFHWFAVVTLVVILFALIAASRQRNRFWAHAHAQAMLGSYYGLFGGLINEVFLRVDVLRQYALSHGPHARNVALTQSVSAAQTSALLIYFILIVYFAIKVRRDRRRRTSSPLAPDSRTERNVAA